jgi:hypothetical protein
LILHLFNNFWHNFKVVPITQPLPRLAPLQPEHLKLISKHFSGAWAELLQLNSPNNSTILLQVPMGLPMEHSPRQIVRHRTGMQLFRSRTSWHSWLGTDSVELTVSLAEGTEEFLLLL